MMKILVTLQRRRTHRYLINLFTKSLIEEVRDLISDREYAKAIEVVYTGGLLEKEVIEQELHDVKADLMLSESYARWDLTH